MISPSSFFPKPCLALALSLALLALACGGGGGGSAAAPAPSITSLNPPSAQPGQTVTLTGQNLNAVTNVLFGTIPASSFIPASDGTLLVAKVPPGAVTTASGAVTVTLVWGSGTIAGPPFTFLAPTTTVAGFTPASGAPGSVILFSGTQFGASVTVNFGATPSPAIQASPDGTQLMAWVPDQLAPGPVNVSLGGGTGPSVFDGPFTVLASRLSALNQPFVEVPGLTPAYTGREFDFPALHRTAEYGLSFPQAPVLHPYDPDTLGADVRPGLLAPRMTLNLKFPPAFRETVLAAVLQQLQASGISLDNVDILCDSEDMIWTGANPYEFRPQGWTDPNAPFSGTYNETSNVSVGLFAAEAAVTLPGPGGSTFFPTQVIVHNETFAPFLVVSSPDSLQMTGINPLNSTSFWSVTVDGLKAAVTLHLVLNDADQAALELVMDQPSPITLGQLAQALAASSLTSPRPAAQFGALFSPVVTGAFLGAVPPTGNPTLTLLGSGFTGATTVTAGTANQPGGSLQVVDDSRVTVTIPATVAAQGNIVVTTPLGFSAPVPLN